MKNHKNGESQKRQMIWRKLSHAIMYLSDLFVFLMVAAWVYVLLLLTVAAIYSMIVFHDTSVFGLLEEAAVLPLSVGGAIWLIRCAINHNNATKQGKHADYDFPNLEEDGNATDAPVAEAEENAHGPEMPMSETLKDEDLQ